jgi:Alpha-L-fucosidase
MSSMWFLRYSSSFLVLLALVLVLDRAASVSGRSSERSAQQGATHDETSSSTESSWGELDRRQVPGWYDEAKFGIFLHWGVFSVPSFGNEWFWHSWQPGGDARYGVFVNATERNKFSYTEYAARFTAELYRPDEWARVFAQSGAQYVVMTSKHHEGFCMYYICFKCWLHC